MADSILNIVIRTRDESQAAFAELQKQLKQLQEALKALNNTPVGAAASQGLNQVATSGNAAAQGLKNAGNQAKETSKDMDFLAGVAKRVVGIFAGFLTVGYVKSLADGAARTEVLGTVLHTTAENAGITAAKIDSVEKSVRELGITTASARQSLSQFIQAGLDITKATELARAAQDLAVVSGRNSSETFARLVTSVQTMNTMSLRLMGIIIDVDEAVQRYAAANDVAASSISKATKQQIVLQAVLDESASKVGIYEASMLNVGKQLQSLDRFQEEAADSAGQVLLPAYSVLVQEFSLFLKQITLTTDAFNATSSAGTTLASVVKPIASGLREIALFAHKNAIALLELAAVIAILVNRMLIFNTARTLLVAGMANLLAGIQYLTLAWKGLVAVFSVSPWGVVLTGLALVVAGITAVYKAFQSSVPADAAEEFGHNVQIMVELEEKLLRAKENTNKASLGLSEQTLEAAKAEEEAIKEQIKTLKKKLEEQEKLLKGAGENTRLIRQQKEEQAKETASRREAQEQIKEVAKALIDLGVAGTAASKGLDISAKFEEGMANFDKVVEEYKKGITQAGKATQVTQGQIDLAAQKVAEGAKSFDEMNAALVKFGAEGSLSRAKLEPLLKSLELKAAKAGLQEAEAALTTFIANAKAAGDTLKVLSSAEDTAQKSSNELVQALLKIGASAGAETQGLDSLIGKLQVTAQSQKDLAAAEIKALEDSADAVDKRYKNEIAQIEATKAARISAADNIINNERGRNAALLSADREASTASIAVAKTKFDALVAIQKQYLAAAISVANEIKKLDEALYESKRTLEEKLFNLSLKGKTDEQKNELLLKQAQDAAAKSEAARLQGNFDLAKTLNDKRIALVDRLNVADTATDDEKAAVAKTLEEAYAQQTKILTDQKSIKEDILRDDVAGYADTLAKVKEITTELAAFAQDQIVKLSVELDSSSLNTVVQQIKDAVSDIEITMKVKTEKFASGGLVSGPGTTKSDSILAALSNREYVMNADAVARYGVNFMDMINRMALPSIPHFAMGGLVTLPAANDSGSSGSGETVNLNINIGGQKVSLMGERNQVRKFVGALKNVEGV